MSEQINPPLGTHLTSDQKKIVLSALEDYRHNLQSLLKMPDLPKKSEEHYRHELKTLDETRQIFNSNQGATQ